MPEPSLADLQHLERLLHLHVKKLIVDDRCQARMMLDQDYIVTLKEAILRGCHLPPVTVFEEAASQRLYWLADGFHRRAAHLAASKPMILVDVHKGGLREAQFYAAAANQKNSLQRKRPDMRRAVLIMLLDPEWGDRMKWSNKRVADHCGVSDTFVGDLRRELLIEREREAERRRRQVENAAKPQSAPAGSDMDDEDEDEVDTPVIVEADEEDLDLIDRIATRRKKPKKAFRDMSDEELREEIDAEQRKHRTTHLRLADEGLHQVTRSLANLKQSDGDDFDVALGHAQKSQAAFEKATRKKAITT